ncbi:MAG: hypothetical protein ABGZ35_01165, partial [Planctomycetaceae bacterium]
LTSDHGWRADPDHRYRPDDRADRRVPLIMKFPNQREGIVDGSEVNAARLGVILEQLFKTPANAARTDKIQSLIDLLTGSDATP